MSYTPSNVNGQATMAASAPVVIASDQSPITVQQNDQSATFSIAANATSGGSITGLAGVSAATVQLVSGTGTIQVQVTVNGTTWVNVTGSNQLINAVTGVYITSGNITAAGIYQVDIAGCSGVRVITTAYTATMVGIVHVTNATAMVSLDGQPTVTVTGTVGISGTQTNYIAGHTTGGATTYLLISAATTNSTLISTGAHTLYAIDAYNNGAGNAYVKIYAKATAPTVGTDTPIKVIMLPPGGGSNIVLPPQGDVVALGLGLGITGGAANTDTTAVALSQVVFNCSYV